MISYEDDNRYRLHNGENATIYVLLINIKKIVIARLPLPAHAMIFALVSFVVASTRGGGGWVDGGIGRCNDGS